MIRALICAAWLLFSSAGGWAGVVLDRVVAVVNRQAILQSEVQEEIRFERLIDGHVPGEASVEETRSVLNRLIDQELLREQMRNSEVKPATEDEVEKQIADLKARLSRNAESWEATLARYGVTEAELRRRIALEFELLRLVDARLRPAVQIEPAEVENYYREQFLPKVLRSGAPQVDQAEAAPKIREILTQQKMNQMLSSWLETLRNQAQIKVLNSDSADPGHGQ